MTSDQIESAVTGAPQQPLEDTTEAVGRLMASLNEMDDEHRRMRRYFCELIGVSMTELNLVLAIGSHKSMTPKALAAELYLTTGAMTALLDRLEAGDMIVRTPHPTDRRSLVIRLSQAGTVARETISRRYFDAVATALAASPELADARFHKNIDFLTQIFGNAIVETAAPDPAISE